MLQYKTSKRGFNVSNKKEGCVKRGKNTSLYYTTHPGKSCSVEAYLPDPTFFVNKICKEILLYLGNRKYSVTVFMFTLAI